MDQELKQYLEGMESRMGSRLSAHFNDRMGKLEDRLTEKMRDMQTKLLRGFSGILRSPDDSLAQS